MQRFIISLVLLSYILSKASNYSTNPRYKAFEKNHQLKNLDLFDEVVADIGAFKSYQNLSDYKEDKLNQNSFMDLRYGRKEDVKQSINDLDNILSGKKVKVGSVIIKKSKIIRTVDSDSEADELKDEMEKEQEKLGKIIMKKRQEDTLRKNLLKTLKKNMDNENERQGFIQKKKLKEDKRLADEERLKRKAIMNLTKNVKKAVQTNKIKFDNMYPDSRMHNQSYKGFKKMDKKFENMYNHYTALVFKTSKKEYEMNRKLAIIRARVNKAQLSKNRNLIDMLGIRRLNIFLEIAKNTYQARLQTLKSIIAKKKKQTLIKIYHQDFLKKCTKITTDLKNLPVAEKNLKDVRQKISDLNKKYNKVTDEEQTKVKHELQSSSTKRDELLKDISQTKNLKKKCPKAVPEAKLNVKFMEQLLKKTNEIQKIYETCVISQKLAQMSFVTLINIKRRMDIQGAISDIYIKRILRHETSMVTMDSDLKLKFIKKMNSKFPAKYNADESDHSTDYKNDVEVLLGKKDHKIAGNKKQFFFPQEHLNDRKNDIDTFQKKLAYGISKIPHPWTKLIFYYKKELDRKLLGKIQELDNKLFKSYLKLESTESQMWKLSKLFEKLNEKVKFNQVKSLTAEKIALIKFIEFFKFENANPITKKNPKHIALNKKMLKDTAIKSKNILALIRMKTDQKKIRDLEMSREVQKIRYMISKNLNKVLSEKKTAKIHLYETSKKYVKQHREKVLEKKEQYKKRYPINIPQSVTDEIAKMNKTLAVCKQQIEHMDKDKAASITLYDKAITTLKARGKGVLEEEQIILSKEKVINKELDSLGLFKVSLPVVMGLQVPEGITCQNENQIYLECYHNDWKESGDETNFYCQLWGKNRGKCSHVKDNGRVIDITELTLPIKKDSICRRDSISLKCVDYKNYTLTNCPTAIKQGHQTCYADPYNPNTFPNCKIESLERVCENKYKTQKRICTFQNSLFFECKTYKKQPCGSKCQRTNRKRLQKKKPKLPPKYKFLYISYMKKVTAEYDVINLSRKNVKRDLDLDLNEDYDVELHGNGLDQVYD